MQTKVYLELFVLDKNGYPLSAKYELLSQNIDEIRATVANASHDLTYHSDLTSLTRRRIDELNKKQTEQSLTSEETYELNELVTSVADALAFLYGETSVVAIYKNIRLFVGKYKLADIRAAHRKLNNDVIVIKETEDPAYRIIPDWPKPAKPEAVPSVQKPSVSQADTVSPDDLSPKPALPRNTPIPVSDLKNYELNEKKNKKVLTNKKK